MSRAILVSVGTVLIVLGASANCSAQVAKKRFITADGQRPAGRLFAPGVMVDNTLYVAGKGDYRPGEPLAAKVENCLSEIRKTLQLAGLDMRHVVKSFVYLEDHEQFAEFNQHYGKFFPEDPPARTTLGVSEVPGDSRLEITCIAYADAAQRKTVGSAPAGYPFSSGVLAGNTLYVSGKGDHRPDGTHPPTIEQQVRQAMRNVETTLKQAGLDFGNVVMSHVFLDKARNLDSAARVYGEFFEKGNEPACATVLVDWIPGGSHVEVTCIATTDLASRKVVRPASVPDSTVPASPGVWAGPTLYLSGLSGLTTAGDSPAPLEKQVHEMARRHLEVIKAADLTLEDIVSGCVYLSEMGDYTDMNAVYREYFSRGPGVRTCLMPGSGLPDDHARVWASFIAAKTQR